MKELVEKIYSLMDGFKKDSELFVVKSNKTAGKRARKASLELAKLMKEFRQESVK